MCLFGQGPEDPEGGGVWVCVRGQTTPDQQWFLRPGSAPLSPWLWSRLASAFRNLAVGEKNKPLLVEATTESTDMQQSWYHSRQPIHE